MCLQLSVSSTVTLPGSILSRDADPIPEYSDPLVPYGYDALSSAREPQRMLVFGRVTSAGSPVMNATVFEGTWVDPVPPALTRSDGGFELKTYAGRTLHAMKDGLR